MAGVRSLDLPTSPRAAVFRAMETIVRGNSTFQRIVKPDNFRTWQGEPRDVKPFDQSNTPCMRWTPMNTGEEFKTPDTMAGDLLINCEVICRGSLLRRPHELLVDAHPVLLPAGRRRPAAGHHPDACKRPGPAAASCSSVSPRSTPAPTACSSPARGRSRSRFRASSTHNRRSNHGPHGKTTEKKF